MKQSGRAGFTSLRENPPMLESTLSGTSHYIQCGLCGHRHPPERARARGYIECACGLRLQVGAAAKRRHRLVGTILGVVIAAAVSGVAYLWARGLG
jgi:hypothetical protein